jgi:D-alanyl-D-alanine carboxypeptidase/D-alanyl-D-alanine-endopeptidase (penicillin-binding protein 4)
VLVHEPDRLLVPASNQKLLTAIGALDALGPDVRLITRVVLGPGGNLVVVGGGDATVRREGPHSLATLADQVRRSGVTSAPRLLVDEARYDGARRASGWQDWQVPTYTGPLSALVVDDNRWRGDAAYLADPALANAEALRAALVARGVSVGAPAAYGSAGGRDTPVASLSSPTVLELVGSMLTDSDNEIADALLREVGAVRAGSGSMAAGAAVTARTVAGLCVSPAGHTDDGSGLSRANARSARAWRTVLQAARAAPWFPSLYDALPVAARTGTLASRLHGTAAEANVRAKTGTLLDGAALAGYATSAGGRPVVFSVVVNGPSPGTATAAIDRFVAALVAHPG